MSKKFEREYKEYLNAQAPDLWDRIESGIDAADVVSIAEVSQKTKSKAGRKKRARYYRLIASVAACLVALCLVVPVYRLVSKKETNETDMAAAEEMALTDATIENTEESGTGTPPAGNDISQSSEGTEMPAEAAAATPERAGEEPETETESMVTASRQSADSEKGVGMGADDGSGNAPDDRGTDTDNGGDIAPGDPDKCSYPMDDSREEAVADLKEQLEIKIAVLASGEQLEEGMLYKAVVIDSAGASLKINDTIQLMLPVGMEVTFEKDVTYAVTLQKQADTGYYSVVGAEAAE